MHERMSLRKYQRLANRSAVSCVAHIRCFDSGRTHTWFSPFLTNPQLKKEMPPTAPPAMMGTQPDIVRRRSVAKLARCSSSDCSNELFRMQMQRRLALVCLYAVARDDESDVG